jgi:hypothetical protein
MSTNPESLRDIHDPLIKYLNQRGYMPIVLPRGGLMPPTLYSLEGNRYVLIRSLASLVDKRADLKRVLQTTAWPTPELEKEIAALHAGKASIGFLGKILARLGIGGDPRIEAALDAGDDTRFKFEGVELRSVEPGLVLDVIRKLPQADFGDAALASHKLHIAYEYLYARKVSIGTGDVLDGSFKAGGKIAEVAEIGVSVQGKRTRAELTSYNGGEPVAFAFKVGRLLRSKGAYGFEWQVQPGFGLAPEEEGPKPYLSRTGQVYEIDNA